MVYPALLPLKRTTRLPAFDWTDVPADLNGPVLFAERRNLVSARVSSHFNWPLLIHTSFVLQPSLVNNSCLLEIFSSPTAAQITNSCVFCTHPVTCVTVHAVISSWDMRLLSSVCKQYIRKKPVFVAARFKACVYGRPPAGIAVSNPTGGMDVCLL